MRFQPLASLGHPTTIAEILLHRAVLTPDAVAYVSTKDVVTDERLTYGELDAYARGVATLLRQVGRGPSRVLLAMPGGLPFVKAFFGTLYAAKIAVPVAIPRSFEARDEAERLRLLRICKDCSPSAVVTVRALAPFLEAMLAAGLEQAPPVLAVDEVDPSPCGMVELARPEELALLQYTSGSTCEPRGVRVQHENIMANQSMILEAFNHDDSTIVGGWLLHYHDMGLIGNLLHPMYIGRPSVLLPTLAFAQRPHLWLKMIDRYRVTTSGGPSFAYELCTRLCAERHVAELDLSCWKVAFDGSEPVRAQTHRRFAERFAARGFSPSAFFPCYGLAEATLFVTGGPRGDADLGRTLLVDAEALAEGKAVPEAGARSVELVSCGRSSPAGEIVIVDNNELTPLPEGWVGEIWVRGPHVTDGYWGDSTRSAEHFGACLGDETSFLRTGDLGLLLDGELFVTGRLKDLIVVHGKNHYPHDIETTLAASLGLDPMRVAVIGDPGHEERLVAVVELERSKPRPGDADVRRAKHDVFSAHGLSMSHLFVAPPGAIPRTSSGKKQRVLLSERVASGLHGLSTETPTGAER